MFLDTMKEFILKVKNNKTISLNEKLTDFFVLVFISHGATAINTWLYDKQNTAALIFGLMFYTGAVCLFCYNNKTK